MACHWLSHIAGALLIEWFLRIFYMFYHNPTNGTSPVRQLEELKINSWEAIFSLLILFDTKADFTRHHKYNVLVDTFANVN